MGRRNGQKEWAAGAGSGSGQGQRAGGAERHGSVQAQGVERETEEDELGGGVGKRSGEKD